MPENPPFSRPPAVQDPAPSPVAGSSGISPQGLWYRFQREPLMTRAIIWTLLAGTLFVAGYLVWQAWASPKPVNPVFAKIDHIKRVRHLRLVRHHYEGLIPVTKPGRREGEQGDLQFLLVAPARIEGYVDLGRLEVRVLPDSLLRIWLPEPALSEVAIDLEQAHEYTLAGKGRFLGRRLERANYFEAYDQIRAAVAATQVRVQQRALENGILEDTRNKTEDYLRNLMRGLGYRVEFVSVGDSLAWPTPPEADLRGMLEAYLDESNPDLRRRKQALVRNLLGL